MKILTVAVLLGLPAVAIALSTTVGAEVPPITNGGNQFAFNVDVSDQTLAEQFLDFHVYPNGGQELAYDSMVAPPGWKASKAANGGVVFTRSKRTKNVPAQEQLNFVLAFNKQPEEQIVHGDVTVVTTNTGLTYRKPGDAIEEVQRTGPITAQAVSADEPHGDHWASAYAVHLGTTATLNLTTPFQNGSYEILHSTVSLDDWSDSQGLGIQAVTSPVPPSWGLGFQDFQGVVAGGQADFSIEVPADPGLIGREFFLVGTVVAGGEVLSHTYDVKITIVP